MSALTDWHKANDEYLANALAWLRARLERLAKEVSPSPQTGEKPAEPSKPSSHSLLERMLKPVLTAKTEDKAAQPTSKVMEDAMEDAKDIPLPPLTDLEKFEHPPALLLLANRFGLTTFEHNVLLLCIAMELDTRIALLCARAQRDSSKAYPTFALALILFDEPEWNVMSPERPLRYWRFIEINQPGAQPLTTSALRADERIVNYSKGLNYLDDRLMPLLMPLADITGDLPPSQQQQVDTIAHTISTNCHGLLVINLLGIDSASKQAIVMRSAQAVGLTVYRLPAEVLPNAWGELETFARLYHRESYLLPIALYLDAQDCDKELPAINHLLTRLTGFVFLDSRETWPRAGREVVSLDITKPTSAEQEQLWQQMLGKEVDTASALLAGQFNLNQPEIQRIAHTVSNPAPYSTSETTLSDPSANKQVSVNHLWDTCLMAMRPRLDTLAQRIEVKARAWEDLVLPEAEKKLLQQIMDQVSQRQLVYEHWGFSRRMSRGLGINALFAGESGTGKTLAAEVIAHQLKLNLYRIDLSQVVSKYIGETEKNLRKLFDAAEDGGTILFFDEADALFGKRSEVKDSHDRYANIEINYLLQRMEAYRGLAILATNMKSALDTAFMRRLRFIVNFPFPGIPERKRIWERVFPEEIDKAALDYEHLAKFNLTGGSIQNIAINAAFLAASSENVVTMPLIFEATRNEFRKLEKPINEAEFRLMQAVGAKA